MCAPHGTRATRVPGRENSADGCTIDMAGLAVRPSEMSPSNIAQAPHKLFPRNEDLFVSRLNRCFRKIRVMHGVVANLMPAPLQDFEIVP